MNLTRERVRQIEVEALAKMREALNGDPKALMRLLRGEDWDEDNDEIHGGALLSIPVLADDMDIDLDFSLGDDDID